MIFGAIRRCGISSTVSLPHPNLKSSSSFRVDFSISSSQVFAGPRLPKELQLSYAAKVNRVGLACQPRKRIDRGVAGASAPRLLILVSSMPTPVGSASFYPLKGLYFFLQKENRPILWKRIASFVAEVGAAAAAIVGTLVGFTFHAQRGLVLQVLPHFLGTPGTIAVILIETAIPMVLLFYKRLQRVQEKLFVDVMELQGVQIQRSSPEEREWIDEQREIQWRQKQAQGGSSIYRTLTDPETLNNRPITKYFLTLPLNFVPVAGQAAFCWLNAMDTATMLHHHYYKLKGLSAEEEATVVHFRKAQYQQFGVVASGLTLFPGANLVLVLTNAVGAALWAADLEKAMQKKR